MRMKMPGRSVLLWMPCVFFYLCLKRFGIMSILTEIARKRKCACAFLHVF